MTRKSYKFRIYPNHAQTTILEQTLNECCWLYNYLLEQRKNSWEINNKSLTRYGQDKTLKSLKLEYPFLQNIYSQILQDVIVRVDLAFRAFFRRIKAGDKPGYPRFKSKNRYDSFTYPQKGFSVDNFLNLSKIGKIKIKQHRSIEGTIKTCTIQRTPTNKWFVIFSCVVDYVPIPQSVEPSIGIDVGLEYFATLSNGIQIDNPRFFRREEKNLSKAQRKFSAYEKDSNARKKARQVVARVHERIAWKRENFAHQEARKIIDRFNTIAVEDLSINDMQKNNFHCMNKSIADAAWRMFLNLLDYKAVEAGKRVIKVNPAYTSQNCSACGARHKLKLSERVYHCPCCGLSLNRDINAAINILSLGLQGLGVSLKAV